METYDDFLRQHVFSPGRWELAAGSRYLVSEAHLQAIYLRLLKLEAMASIPVPTGIPSLRTSPIKDPLPTGCENHVWVAAWTGKFWVWECQFCGSQDRRLPFSGEESAP